MKKCVQREKLDEKFKQLHGFNGFTCKTVITGFTMLCQVLLILRKALELLLMKISTVNDKIELDIPEGRRCSLAECYLKDALKKVELHLGSDLYEFGKVIAVDIRSYAHVLDIIGDEKNEKENIAIVRKELPVGRNFWDYSSYLFAAKANPGEIHHWNSGSETGIIHKANES
ncbi:34536_t:CDS:2 [Racocetra persica]|uniref:34536_t:CDS:1 n=1 Tax=Racocetra persica TaxID=160502 RepID=A0ACA9N3Q4_9GLOM|nr:34536_t:CDS:2 [Racocetra persica]